MDGSHALRRSCYVNISCCCLHAEAMVSYSFPAPLPLGPSPGSPPQGLQLGWAAETPSPAPCKVTALFIPRFSFSPPPGSDVG